MQLAKRSELKDLIEAKIREVLEQRDDFVGEPFFRDSRTAKEIRRLQTVDEQKKWSVYFHRHGCLICDTRERTYAANGMCARCRRRTYERLREILSETKRKDEQPLTPVASLDLEKIAAEVFQSVFESLPARSPATCETARLRTVQRFDPQEVESESGVLERLVQQQIAEMLTKEDDLTFEPFFRGRQVSYELRRMLIAPERQKWGKFFDAWGCLRCRTKNSPHGSSGFCRGCRGLISDRLNSILSRRKFVIRGRPSHLDESLLHLPESAPPPAQKPSPRTIDVTPIRVEGGSK
jgi:hypothetical protein